MSALRTVLLGWNLNRLTRVAVSGVVVFIAVQLTDGLLVGLAVAIVLAILLDTPWWLYERYANRNDGVER